MIITCPYCSTRYQVASDAIGALGRKVQCAHCNEAWREDTAPPEHPTQDDILFADFTEDGLDEALIDEEWAAASEAKSPAHLRREALKPDIITADPSLAGSRNEAFRARQHFAARQFPLARARRGLRWTAIGLVVGLPLIAYFARYPIVTLLPEMAGVYGAIGLKVNVIGLDIVGVTTLRAMHDGQDTLTVNAEIIGLAPRLVSVPQVLLTLLDAGGQPIYQWSVRPDAAELGQGERVALQTSIPLHDGVSVRLAFADSAAPKPPLIVGDH